MSVLASYVSSADIHSGGFLFEIENIHVISQSSTNFVCRSRLLDLSGSLPYCPPVDGTIVHFPNSHIDHFTPDTLLLIEVFDNTAKSVRSGYMGSALVRLFNRKGALVAGHHAAVLDPSIGVFCEDSEFSKNLHSSIHYGKCNTEIGKELDSYFIARSLGIDSTDLVREVSHLQILFRNQALPVIYSDHFASAILTPPGGSSEKSTFSSPQLMPRKWSRAESVDSAGSVPGTGLTITNWMAINGPIHVVSDKRGEITGTGYIPVSDLSSAISPCPIQLIEYELFRDHPAAVKNLKISRVGGASLIFSTARPNAEQMTRLREILLQPVHALSREERDLVLKYSWSLRENKGALLKVLLAVKDLQIEQQMDVARDVRDCLAVWTPIDLDLALALLGEEIGSWTAYSRIIREYAIGRLSVIASNDEISLFVYQLVQSLRFEDPLDNMLGSFLIDRATKDDALATNLFWHLQCEGEQCMQNVAQNFWKEMGKSTDGLAIRERIETQCQFRLRLLDIAGILRNPPVPTRDKNELLRECIKGTFVFGTSRVRLANLTTPLNFPQVGSVPIEIPIPIDPTYTLVKIDEKNSFSIKSAKTPFVVTCEVFNRESKITELKKYMFKTGDDLRQDQLVIQFIQLIDSLLKTYGLDLKLTPYKVLATSSNDGFVEFVSNSFTLSSVLANNNNDLMTFFRNQRPNPDALFGVEPAVLDTFARSCAGYGAITYILGIGDRHLENLLVTADGRLFHVDFGFILGRDPKPFPPPMKLCKEMVEGMGGTQSVYYKSFVSKCTQAFLILRRHANLLISLLYLAANGDIKDMKEQDPEMAIMKVQKRLMPEVSDEIAEHHMINLINESTNALFPVVFEKLHKWAAYWRQ